MLLKLNNRRTTCPQSNYVPLSQLVTNYSQRGGCNTQFHSPVKYAQLFITVRERENNSILQITVGENTFSGLKRGCCSFSFQLAYHIGNISVEGGEGFVWIILQICKYPSCFLIILSMITAGTYLASHLEALLARQYPGAWPVALFSITLLTACQGRPCFNSSARYMRPLSKSQFVPLPTYAAPKQQVKLKT